MLVRGGGQLSELEQKCIKSWEEVLTDYRIIRWDESNFPIKEFPYVSAAYDARKWAFVSDYVRVWALYNFGGIYFDTDYEIVKSIDEFLEKSVFLGAENGEYVGTAIMGAEKENWLLRSMLNYYENNPFEIAEGKYNMIPNTMVLTDLLVKKGYHRGESETINGVYIAPKDVFYPSLRGINTVHGSYGIHYFRGSWWSEKERNRANSNVYKRMIRPFLIHMKKLLGKLVGADTARKIEMQIKNILK